MPNSFPGTVTTNAFFRRSSALIALGTMFIRSGCLKKDTSSSLRHSLGYTFIIAAAVIMLLFLFSNPFIRLIFGEGYSIGYLPGFLGIAFGALSLSNVLVTYNLAVGRKRLLFLLPLFMLLEILTITLFHNSMMQIAGGLMALLVPLFLILFLVNRKEIFGRWQRKV